MAVRSDLGPRSTGPGKKPAKDVAVRAIEFATIASADELEEQEWGLFEARFSRSAQSVGFPGLSPRMPAIRSG